MTKKHKEEVVKKTVELPPQQSEIDSLKGQLKEKDKMIEDNKNRFMRALADLDNYKKRASLEKDDLIRYSNEQLIKELLPAIDGFAKAIEFAKKTNNEELIKGIALTKKLFEDALSKFGVKEVESAGKPYDPNMHEAILMKESDKPSGVVIEEMQKGYTMNGRLIRPAMVIVSKGGK